MARHPREDHIMKWLRTKPSTEILFHHRFPTSTENVKNACHPFSTYDHFGDNQYVLVHNGVMSNEEILQRRHETLGIKYSSMQPDGAFNDSEALLWDVALYLEGEQKELAAKGSIAFICFKRSPEGNRLFFGRNSGSPLYMKYTKKQLALTSEGRGDPVKTDQLYEFDYNSLTLKHDDLEIPSSFYSYSEGQFRQHNNYNAKTRQESTEDSYWEDNDDGAYPPYGTTADLDNLTHKIQTKVRQVMDEANGYYSVAFEILEENIRTLDAKKILTIPDMADCEVLKGAQSVILQDAFWTDLAPDVRDPVYITREAQLKLGAPLVHSATS